VGRDARRGSRAEKGDTITRYGTQEDLERLEALYDGASAEQLLRMASQCDPPFDLPATFAPVAVSDAVARARARPNLLIDVRAPFRRWLVADPSKLSIMAQPIPAGVSPFTLFAIVGVSDSIRTLVANLRLALELVGSDGEQLVSSMESRGRTGRNFYHVVACIPGSR